MAKSVKMNKQIKYWFLLAVILSTLGVQGCLPKAPLRLGFTAELTGKQSELGDSLRNGVQLAVEELNAAGGIAGRPLELLVEDDAGVPDGARRAEEKLIDAGAVALIGHLTSSQTLAGYEVAQSRGVALLSATASTSLLSGKKDLFFRTVLSTDALGRGLARHVRQTRRLGRLAVIYDLDNNAYSEPFVEAFSDTFIALGGQVTGQATFSAGQAPDFAPLAAQLKAAQPEGVLLVTSPTDTAVIAQIMRLGGWRPALFSSSWAQGDGLIRNGGQAVEGMELILAIDTNDPAPALQAFKIRYEQRFAHAPNFYAIEGYETLQMLAMALKETGGQAKGLPEALSRLKGFQGLTGTIQMDEFGDALRPLYIQRVTQGRFETVDVFYPGR